MVALALSTVVASALPAAAGVVNWIDWQTSSSENGFTAKGVITSGSETIDVTYNNPRGVGFFQNGVSGNLIDYFTSSGPNSPYESVGTNGVDNRPPAAEMIALQYAGQQTLTFSKTVQNLFLSFVSLNGNGWRFDQDFKILSYTGGNLDGAGTDNAGYWGTGSVTRIDNGDGTYSMNNLTSGEPHGTILLLDKFDTLTWTSLNNEFWNGFTVGIQGTDDQVPDDPGPGAVPVPAAGLLLFGAIGGLAAMRRRKRAA
jgi:hypothetical protein